jgi:hypothetical protein
MSPLHLVSQAASTSPAGQLPKPNTVKAGLTPKRQGQRVENDESSAFVRRILSADARRDGDVEALDLMLRLAGEIDTAIAEAGPKLAGRHRRHLSANMVIEALRRVGMSENLAYDTRSLGRDLATIARVDKWPGAV